MRIFRDGALFTAFGQDEDLARIDKVGISNPASVRLVNKRVERAHAIGGTADAPQAIATGYDGGRDPGRRDGGR